MATAFSPTTNLLLHSPATKHVSFNQGEKYEERFSEVTSSIAQLGRRNVREYRSEFILPNDVAVAVSRQEAYIPALDSLNVSVSLATGADWVEVNTNPDTRHNTLCIGNYLHQDPWAKFILRCDVSTEGNLMSLFTEEWTEDEQTASDSLEVSTNEPSFLPPDNISTVNMKLLSSEQENSRLPTVRSSVPPSQENSSNMSFPCFDTFSNQNLPKKDIMDSVIEPKKESAQRSGKQTDASTKPKTGLQIVHETSSFTPNSTGLIKEKPSEPFIPFVDEPSGTVPNRKLDAPFLKVESPTEPSVLSQSLKYYLPEAKVSPEGLETNSPSSFASHEVDGHNEESSGSEQEVHIVYGIRSRRNKPTTAEEWKKLDEYVDQRVAEHIPTIESLASNKNEVITVESKRVHRSQMCRRDYIKEIRHSSDPEEEDTETVIEDSHYHSSPVTSYRETIFTVQPNGTRVDSSINTSTNPFETKDTVNSASEKKSNVPLPCFVENIRIDKTSPQKSTHTHQSRSERRPQEGKVDLPSPDHLTTNDSKDKKLSGVVIRRHPNGNSKQENARSKSLPPSSHSKNITPMDMEDILNQMEVRAFETLERANQSTTNLSGSGVLTIPLSIEKSPSNSKELSLSGPTPVKPFTSEITPSNVLDKHKSTKNVEPSKPLGAYRPNPLQININDSVDHGKPVNRVKSPCESDSSESSHQNNESHVIAGGKMPPFSPPFRKKTSEMSIDMYIPPSVDKKAPHISGLRSELLLTKPSTDLDVSISPITTAPSQKAKKSKSAKRPTHHEKDIARRSSSSDNSLCDIEERQQRRRSLNPLSPPLTSDHKSPQSKITEQITVPQSTSVTRSGKKPKKSSSIKTRESGRKLPHATAPQTHPSSNNRSEEAPKEDTNSTLGDLTLPSKTESSQNPSKNKSESLASVRRPVIDRNEVEVSLKKERGRVRGHTKGHLKPNEKRNSPTDSEGTMDMQTYSLSGPMTFNPSSTVAPSHEQTVMREKPHPSENVDRNSIMYRGAVRDRSREIDERCRRSAEGNNFVIHKRKRPPVAKRAAQSTASFEREPSVSSFFSSSSEFEQYDEMIEIPNSLKDKSPSSHGKMDSALMSASDGLGPVHKPNIKHDQLNKHFETDKDRYSTATELSDSYVGVSSASQPRDVIPPPLYPVTGGHYQDYSSTSASDSELNSEAASVKESKYLPSTDRETSFASGKSKEVKKMPTSNQPGNRGQVYDAIKGRTLPSSSYGSEDEVGDTFEIVKNATPSTKLNPKSSSNSHEIPATNLPNQHLNRLEPSQTNPPELKGTDPRQKTMKSSQNSYQPLKEQEKIQKAGDECHDLGGKETPKEKERKPTTERFEKEFGSGRPSMTFKSTDKGMKGDPQQSVNEGEKTQKSVVEPLEHDEKGLSNKRAHKATTERFEKEFVSPRGKATKHPVQSPSDIPEDYPIQYVGTNPDILMDQPGSNGSQTLSTTTRPANQSNSNKLESLTGEKLQPGNAAGKRGIALQDPVPTVNLDLKKSDPMNGYPPAEKSNLKNVLVDSPTAPVRPSDLAPSNLRNSIPLEELHSTIIATSVEKKEIRLWERKDEEEEIMEETLIATLGGRDRQVPSKTKGSELHENLHNGNDVSKATSKFQEKTNVEPISIEALLHAAKYSDPENSEPTHESNEYQPEDEIVPVAILPRPMHGEAKLTFSQARDYLGKSELPVEQVVDLDEKGFDRNGRDMAPTPLFSEETNIDELDDETDSGEHSFNESNANVMSPSILLRSHLSTQPSELDSLDPFNIYKNQSAKDKKKDEDYEATDKYDVPSLNSQEFPKFSRSGNRDYPSLKNMGHPLSENVNQNSSDDLSMNGKKILSPNLRMSLPPAIVTDHQPLQRSEISHPYEKANSLTFPLSENASISNIPETIKIRHSYQRFVPLSVIPPAFVKPTYSSMAPSQAQNGTILSSTESNPNLDKSAIPGATLPSSIFVPVVPRSTLGGSSVASGRSRRSGRPSSRPLVNTIHVPKRVKPGNATNQLGNVDSQSETMSPKVIGKLQNTPDHGQSPVSGASDRNSVILRPKTLSQVGNNNRSSKNMAPQSLDLTQAAIDFAINFPQKMQEEKDAIREQERRLTMSSNRGSMEPLTAASLAAQLSQQLQQADERHRKRLLESGVYINENMDPDKRSSYGKTYDGDIRNRIRVPVRNPDNWTGGPQSRMHFQMYEDCLLNKKQVRPIEAVTPVGPEHVFSPSLSTSRYHRRASSIGRLTQKFFPSSGTLNVDGSEVLLRRGSMGVRSGSQDRLSGTLQALSRSKRSRSLPLPQTDRLSSLLRLDQGRVGASDYAEQVYLDPLINPRLCFETCV